MKKSQEALSNTRSYEEREGEHGNLLFIIILSIALIGLLSAVIASSSNPENAQIDNERLTILIAEVQRQVAEFERGVNFALNNGYRDSEIRFAHPMADAEYGDLAADADPTNQVFSPSGGAATYRTPPRLINDGSPWEFYGNSIIPSVGTNAPDLIAVLPNVTQQFCEAINELNGQVQPTDTGTCINTGSTARFDDGTQFGGATNAIPTANFATDPTTAQAKPALQACVACGANYHFYHVLIAR